MSKNEMITLPREVADLALYALATMNAPARKLAMTELRKALDRPQPDQAPYLWYDPENGDTWTQEAIDEGFCATDGLIPLYTKDEK